jgi:hypothetical protein
MESVGGRRAADKAAAIGASPSLAGAGIRPALAHRSDPDRRHCGRSRDLALVEWLCARWTSKTPSCGRSSARTIE